MLAPDVRVEFRLDRTRSTQLQLAQLETYVRELRAMFTPLNFDINRLDRAVAQAKAHASGAASQALVDTRAEIKRFGDSSTNCRQLTSESPLSAW